MISKVLSNLSHSMVTELDRVGEKKSNLKVCFQGILCVPFKFHLVFCTFHIIENILSREKDTRRFELLSLFLMSCARPWTDILLGLKKKV